METIAFAVNNLFLVLYTICGGIDFGVGILILIFLFQKKDPGLLLKAFTPLWEVNNVFLVFFIVTFYFFFPKSIPYYSQIFIIPAFLALFFLFIRTGSYLLLYFYKKTNLIHFIFGLSSFLACIYFASFYLQFLEPVNKVSDLFSLSIQNISFYFIAVISAILLASRFILFLTKEEVLIERLKNINKISYVLWYILFMFIMFICYLPNSVLLNPLLSILNLIIVTIGLILIISIPTNKKILFFTELISILFVLISILTAQYPYLSYFNRLLISDSIPQQNVLTMLLIVIIAGVAISLPSIVFFYKMFLKNELDYE